MYGKEAQAARYQRRLRGRDQTSGAPLPVLTSRFRGRARKRAANQVLGLAVNTSKDVERQVKARVRELQRESLKQVVS
jgi:hypothetical protein